MASSDDNDDIFGGASEDRFSSSLRSAGRGVTFESPAQNPGGLSLNLPDTTNGAQANQPPAPPPYRHRSLSPARDQDRSRRHRSASPHRSAASFPRMDSAILETLAEITTTLARTQQHAQSSNPLRGHKIPSFDGSNTSDFLTWKDQVLSVFDYLQWGNDQRAQYLPVILTKRAKQHYESLPQHVRDDFPACLASLEATFSLLNKPLIIRSALLRKSQGSTESVSTYTDRMMETFRQLNMSDQSQMLSEYVSGLRPHIQADVEKALPASLTQAIHLAEASEHAGALSKGADIDHLTSLMAKLEKKIDDTTKSLNSATLNNAESPSTSYSYHNRPSASRGRSHSHFRGGRAHSHRPTQSSDYDQRHPFCLRCNCRHPYGQHTHYQSSSRGRSQRSRASTQSMGSRGNCYRCGQPGHFASTCTVQQH